MSDQAVALVELQRGHYVRIATAETLRFADRTPVRSPAGYVGWLAEHLLDKGDQARPWLCDLEVAARIEWGRWVVDCPNCQVIAPLTHPVWRLACCAECGIVLRHVIVPDDYAALERVLLTRPQRLNHNWLPSQTLAELIVENQTHGVAA